VASIYGEAMNLTDFKDLAQGIQSLAVAAAVVAGGIWAIYRFWSLRELDKAKVELERLRKTMTERGTLNISVTARSLSRPNGDGYYIELMASLSNVGNRTEVLNWSDGGVYTAPVEGQAKGNVIFGDWIETNLVGLRGVRISSALAPAETRIYPFIIPIDNPGLYYVAFAVVGTPEEMEQAMKEHDKVSKEKPGDIRWFAETYVVVESIEHPENNSAT
jgi:hypothetical protein